MNKYEILWDAGTGLVCATTFYFTGHPWKECFLVGFAIIGVLKFGKSVV